MEGRKFSQEEITYELFDIDPAEFYKDKFALGKGHCNNLDNPVFRHELGYEKIRRLISDLKTHLPSGGRVLDVGCGAAPYGPTILANVPGVTLVGVDMSEACLRQATSNGYCDCKVFDLSKPLPFDHDSFDAVFSMDLFGHIEFRYKDRLIEETARVTRRGGLGHHGVETGYVDYYNCNPKDEADPVRRYVYIDGHIGAEPAEDVCARFSRRFATVNHRMTYLYPFLSKDAFASCFGAEFQKLLAEHDHPIANQLVHIMLGKLNSYFIDLYSEVFGDVFKPNDAPPRQLSEPHLQAKNELLARIAEHNREYGVDFIQVPKQLFRPAGFSSITAIK